VRDVGALKWGSHNDCVSSWVEDPLISEPGLSRRKIDVELCGTYYEHSCERSMWGMVISKIDVPVDEAMCTYDV
jgi:hypothetical protein